MTSNIHQHCKQWTQEREPTTNNNNIMPLMCPQLGVWMLLCKTNDFLFVARLQVPSQIKHPTANTGATTDNKQQITNNQPTTNQPTDNQTPNNGHKSDTPGHAVLVSLLCPLFGVMVYIGCHGRWPSTAHQSTTNNQQPTNRQRPLYQDKQTSNNPPKSGHRSDNQQPRTNNQQTTN